MKRPPVTYDDDSMLMSSHLERTSLDDHNSLRGSRPLPALYEHALQPDYGRLPPSKLAPLPSFDDSALTGGKKKKKKKRVDALLDDNDLAYMSGRNQSVYYD